MNSGLLFLIIGLYLMALSTCLVGRTQHVEQSTAVSLCSPEVKKAIKRMGPYKDYRLFPGIGGRLEVRVDGDWLKLRY